jgi:hypothetical protein
VTTVHVWGAMVFLTAARSSILVRCVEGMVQHVLLYLPLTPRCYPPPPTQAELSLFWEQA